MLETKELTIRFGGHMAVNAVSCTSQPGTLTVNGTGNYRVVTLAAVRTLAGQTRGPMNVAAFLEGINADPSRNGDANAPAAAFTSALPSATFNDRLAY